MFNFGLAREIYGVSPWHVDVETLPSLLSILENHSQMEIPEVKYNTPGIYYLNDTKLIDRPYGNRWNPGQLESSEKFVGIGVLMINGPITVGGGASSMGMEQVSEIMYKMAADERIKSFMIIANSGGGSSAAVEIMTETISNIDKTKPVHGLVKRAGTACSAMYGILSACRTIHAESEMSLVGSCGTMMQFEGRAANSEHDGKKFIRLYASKSTEKNGPIEEALNNDNYELIYSELLDPINDRFLNLIESNRPVLKESGFDTGKALFAKDAIGTYIDGIKTMSEVVQMMEQEIKEMPTPASKGINPINKNHVMTAEQLKQDHPETYNAIFKAGVKTESSRTQAWMAHANADLEKVQEGIKSGEEITSGDREELMIKAFSQKQIQTIEQESAEPVNTPESGSEPENAEEAELNQLNSLIDSQLN